MNNALPFKSFKYIIKAKDPLWFRIKHSHCINALSWIIVPSSAPNIFDSKHQPIKMKFFSLLFNLSFLVFSLLFNLGTLIFSLSFNIGALIFSRTTESPIVDHDPRIVDFKPIGYTPSEIQSACYPSVPTFRDPHVCISWRPVAHCKIEPRHECHNCPILDSIDICDSWIPETQFRKRKINRNSSYFAREKMLDNQDIAWPLSQEKQHEKLQRQRPCPSPKSLDKPLWELLQEKKRKIIE